MKTSRLVLILVGVGMAASIAWAEKAEPLAALAKMPVKEITVFKDGHAFVLHSGKMPTNDAGNVLMDYLPVPVIGTFWPYSAEKKARLSAVTASQRKVLVERTALNLRELIEANIGAEVLVTETQAVEGDRRSYRAIILRVPTRSGEELETTSPPNSGQMLPKQGDVVLLQVLDGSLKGTRVVSFSRISDITFVGEHRQEIAGEELRNLLTLKLDWVDDKPQAQADVGLLYLQLGLRWIPAYKVTIDGNGNAAVKLEATLINELTDLDDVTAHLVIGVPTFAFKGDIDPISLQQAAAQLSQYFRPEAQTGYAFSNAIMTQQALALPGGNHDRREVGNERTIDLGPEVSNSGKNEDLFVFSVKHVSLKKGQRMVLPIREFTLKYKDVYALDIPFAPPPEVWRNIDSQRGTELARLLASPKVKHRIRLFNTSDVPLTTAPALILRDEKILAQALMTYAAAGSDADLDIGTAVDVRVKKSEKETKRTPNAVVWQGDSYGRIDLFGTISLTSFATQSIEVEVTRKVLGNVTGADHKGKIEMVNTFEDRTLDAGDPHPYWWGWFSWPWWWGHFNGVGQVRWVVAVEPNKPINLAYSWHYFWR